MQPDQTNPLSLYLANTTPATQVSGVLPPGQNPTASSSANVSSSQPVDAWTAEQQSFPPNPQGVAAQNAAIADPEGNTDLSSAGGQLDGHDYEGLCQEYVDDQTGTSQRYPTAIATWNANQKTGNAVAGTQGIQPGDVVEFAGDSTNGGAGHAGIYEGNGNFKSATYSGVQTNNLSTWIKNTGQTLLGYYTPTSGK